MTDHHELFMVHQKNAATTDRDWLDEALAGFHAVRDSSVKIDLGLVHRCDAGSCGELRSVLREAIRRHTYSRDEVLNVAFDSIGRAIDVLFRENAEIDEPDARTIAHNVVAEHDRQKEHQT